MYVARCVYMYGRMAMPNIGTKIKISQSIESV